MPNSIPEHLLHKHSERIAYFAPSTPPISRGAVLTWVIGFEYDFQLYVLAALRQIRPDIPDSVFGEDGIFAEPNMLSTLSKCLPLADVLGLVSPDELHDIRKLVRLRNMYAHGRTRTEFRDDEKAKAVMHQMRIYVHNKGRLDALDPGRAFHCCVDFLSESVNEKRLALESANG